MISLYCILWIAVIRSNQALLSEIVDDIHQHQIAQCFPDGRDCLKEPHPTGDINTNYRSNEIIFKDWIEGNEGECCYRYESHYTSNPNCEGQTIPQSQWTLAPVCKDASVKMSITAGSNRICHKGIVFDSPCDRRVESPCSYTLCVKYSNYNDKCCVHPSWYAVQSGNTVAFGEIDAPSCECETKHSPQRVLLDDSSSEEDTQSPTRKPTGNPTEDPTVSPTRNPTISPTKNPTVSPTRNPTVSPTKNPTQSPTRIPSVSPTKSPTRNPTESPTRNPTISPTKNPTVSPTRNPTVSPTENPTESPTKNPTISPTRNPTVSPTKNPTVSPTGNPTISPTKNPTVSPTRNPTISPTKNPTQNPTPSPTTHCNPKVSIAVNPGCDENTFATEDTNVVYAPIKTYTDANEVSGTFTDTPESQLSQMILDHSCDTDAPAAMNVPIWKSPDHIVPGSHMHDINPSVVWFNHAHWFVIGLLCVYGMSVTSLWVKKERGGSFEDGNPVKMMDSSDVSDFSMEEEDAEKEDLW